MDYIFMKLCNPQNINQDYVILVLDNHDHDTRSRCEIALNTIQLLTKLYTKKPK